MKTGGHGCAQANGPQLVCEPRRYRGRENVRGFTLIEVLIALAIVAIALGAVLRAIGALSSTISRVRSSSNTLAASRRSTPCSRLRLVIQPTTLPAVATVQ